MNCIRLVLFDVTDTILRPRPLAAGQYARMAVKHLGLPVNDLSSAEQCLRKTFLNQYKDHRVKYPCFGALHGMPSKTWWFDVFSACMKELNLPTYSDQQLHSAFDDVYFNFVWDTMPHVKNVLSSLKNIRSTNNGDFVKLAVLSNSDNRTSMQLSQKGLLHFFETVVTSEEAKCEKPDPRIFGFALDKLSLSDIERNQVLYVGNSYEKDYIGSRNVGFQALLITSERHPLLKDEHRLSDLTQVLDYVMLANR